MIDPTIPLRVQSPQISTGADALAKILPLAQAQQQMRLSDLQYSELQRKIADEEATKQALSGYLGGTVSLADLARTNPTAYYKIVEENRKREKDQADIDKNKAETRLTEIKTVKERSSQLAQLLGSAKDQTSYELAVAAARQRFGEDAVKNVPPVYSKAWVEQQLEAVIDADKKLDLLLKREQFDFDKKYKGEQQKLDERRTAATEKQAGAAVTQANTAAARERREAAKEGQPSGVPFKARRKDTGEEVLLLRNDRGEFFDANTRRKIDFEVSPEAPSVSPDQAGRIAMIKQGKLDASRAIGLLFDKDEQGNVTGLKRLTAAEMRTPWTAGGWSEDSRQAFSYIRNAVAGKLRAETGAAAPASEIDDIMKRFMPSPIDTKDTALDKVQRLEEFFDISLDEMYRAGYISKPTYEKGTKVGGGREASGKIKNLAAEHGGKPL